MLLYTTDSSPRLTYIANFIAGEVLGKPFTIVTDQSAFMDSDLPKINYSDKRMSQDEVWIKPNRLLFETGIHKQEISFLGTGGQTSFFKTEGDCGFDLLAASFYLISRYEEYLPYQKDSYGRFAHQNSAAFLHGFLDLPLVNYWLADFRKTIMRKYPELKCVEKKFSFIPTYDIDEAYSYRHKGLLRAAGGWTKALLYFDLEQVQKRMHVWLGKQEDPYDAFQWMDEVNHQFNLQPRYFFLVPSRLSRYDRNILPEKPALRNLIIAHANKYAVGLHPSWRSGDQPERIQTEAKTLETLTRVPVLSSRQHYIRFTLPETYRHLMAAGIREDFSMGYGSINGFRASVATPFYWFDLERNVATPLKIYPFCYMDANSYFEQKESPQQALDEMIRYFETVRSVNGCLITIWHNTFLGTEKRFDGWRDCYWQFLNHIRSWI